MKKDQNETIIVLEAAEKIDKLRTYLLGFDGDDVEHLPPMAEPSWLKALAFLELARQELIACDYFRMRE